MSQFMRFLYLKHMQVTKAMTSLDKYKFSLSLLLPHTQCNDLCNMYEGLDGGGGGLVFTIH